MYKLFVNILKVLLIVSLLVLAVLLVFGVALSFGWPLWVGGFILVGLAGIGIGIYLLRKVWHRRREQRFVNEVVAQDEAYIRSLSDRDKQDYKELQVRWKDAVETLRKSHLRKYGNPLYVLPWYMLVGESGSGKTTAVQSARLSSPFAEISSTSGISGTKNCDWWFFDNAILIDTAGRYAVPVDESRDTDEWQKFLTLLKKFRKKESLNGLVVTVAADKLMADRPEPVEAAAKSVRRRIDELMFVLGTKFPIYILVTKCDLVQGMTHFCDHLDENRLNQAMGVLNDDFSKAHAEFIHQAVASITDRLKDLRLELFQKPGVNRKAAGILMFPEEFSKLKPGLDAFIRGAFQESPYQEKPILRGLFFSSGRQEGAPFSQLLRELGLADAKEVLPGTNKGLFLHDFFSKILPGDRGLFAPTQRTLAWGRLTRNLGLTAWVAVCIALCGMLSFSFVKNLSAIREVSREFQQPIIFQNDIMADAIKLDRYLAGIISVEEKNRHFRIPRLGLRESRNVEMRLKSDFCDKYHEGFLSSFDNRKTAHMARFSAATPNETLGRHVSHIVRRIHLVQAKMENKSAAALSRQVRPAFTPLLVQAGDSIAVPDLDEKLSRMYAHYVLWQADRSALNAELNHLQKWLGHILALDGVTLNWLADWVNSDPGLSPVRMSDYWGNVRFEEDVQQAFTIDGKNRIDLFVSDIETALYDPLVIAGKKLDFYKWYNQQYFSAWHDFATVFANGPETLENKDKWARIASRIGTEQDPYFLVLGVMARHLEPYADVAVRPAWVDFVFDFQMAWQEAEVIGTKEGIEDSPLGRKAVRQVQTAIQRAERTVGISSRLRDTGNLLLAGQALVSYRESLVEIAPVATSRRLAYQLAADFYRQDESPDSGESAFMSAYDQADILIGVLSDPGRDLAAMDLLIAGPVAFLHEFSIREAACYLQEAWERQVLLDVKNIAHMDVTQLLMGDRGLARRFIDGSAAPFIDRSMQRGYHPFTRKEKAVGFAQPFMSYLNRAERAYRTAQSTYNIVVRAEPTGANPEARVRPHQTLLQLNCQPGPIQLVNLNYPVSRSFAYSPQACNDVRITVDIGNLNLTKTYTGYLAFPNFIRDFESGRRRFSIGYFPEHQLALRQMGVEYISMAFGFQGHEPVLSFLSVASEPVPEAIAACWD